MKTKIRTTYIPATDTTGSRVKATGNGLTRSIPYPHELSGPAVGKAAAVAFCEAFGLNPETLREVNTPTGKRGYTFMAELIPET
jgi:hypothetical protein